MTIARRCAWVLAFIAGLPGMLLGFVTLYALFVFPAAFGIGLATARSELGIRLTQILFAALGLGLAFGLGRGLGGDDRWFYCLFGTSALFALLAAFKAGMVARLRLF